MTVVVAPVSRRGLALTSPIQNDRVFQAFSKEVAKRILVEGHHRHTQSCLGKVATALGASGPNTLSVHFTPSPLSSASLLASTIKHKILRNMEHMSTPVIRRTLDYASEKHPIWIHSTPQAPRRLQFEQASSYLKLRERALLARLKFNQENSVLTNELDSIRIQSRKLSLVKTYLEDNVKGNLHPSSLMQGGDRVLLTPTEAAQLPSPTATIRGIFIRIKGPRRGNRAMVWQRSAGRISVNSVKYVVAEEAKLPIPSKLGIYGLTIRIVYSQRSRLVGCRTILNVLDQPGFTFHSP